MRRYEYQLDCVNASDVFLKLAMVDKEGWDLVCAHPHPVAHSQTVLYFRRATNHVLAMVDALTRESAPAMAATEGVTVH